MRLASPEHAQAQDAKALAYVRPHDLEVRRYVAGDSQGSGTRGIPAKLVRAIVVGPIARLELLPLDATATGSKDPIEAHLPAQAYAALAVREGDTVLLTPRKARVFVDTGVDDPALSI